MGTASPEATLLFQNTNTSMRTEDEMPRRGIGLFGFVVATAQYGFQPDRPYAPTVVFSLLISVSIWAIIDIGRSLNILVTAEGVETADHVRILQELGFWIVMTHSHKAKNTTHQCGTLVFGTDPRKSVLDAFCRAHDVENLFVVDASFFPSSAAVNPGLTIAAQALRVADHIMATDLKHL